METVLLGLGVLAVICWGLGAYNRLVRLRAAVVGALAGVDTAMRDELGWAMAQGPEAQSFDASEMPASTDADAAATDDAGDAAPTPPDDADTEAWRSGAAAARQLEAALSQARLQPLDAPTMAMLSAAYQVFEQSLDRMPEHAVSVSVEDAMNERVGIPKDVMSRAQLELALGAAIQDFNARVAEHNLAIARMPARVLARFLGYVPAGQLTGLRHTP